MDYMLTAMLIGLRSNFKLVAAVMCVYVFIASLLLPQC